MMGDISHIDNRWWIRYPPSMTTKLEMLLQTAATAFNVPLGSAEASWTRLRKAGLWTPVGRGRVRPDPTPSDATNLILSFMVGGLATETPEAVRDVRGSIAMKGDLPIVGLAGKETLGTLLECLLSLRAANETLVVDDVAWDEMVSTLQWPEEAKKALRESGRIADAGNLFITRTFVGWQAVMSVASLHCVKLRWDAFYYLLKEDQAERLEARANEAVPDRRTEEVITKRTLDAIAACLRGDAAGAQRALSIGTRVYRRLPRDPDEKSLVDVDIASGTITLVEPDYAGSEQWRDDLMRRSAQEVQSPETSTQLEAEAPTKPRRRRRR